MTTLQFVTPTALQFGLKRAEIGDHPALWGFRAIYDSQRGGIDFLPDRQDMKSHREVERTALMEALNGGAIAQLREWARARENLFNPLEPSVTVVQKGGVTFHLSTNASGGYLYGTAYLTP